MIQLILNLKMTIAQVVETSVTVNNSPIQDYVHLQDHAQRTQVNNYMYYAWLKQWTYPRPIASKFVFLCRLLRLMFFAQEKVFFPAFSLWTCLRNNPLTIVLVWTQTFVCVCKLLRTRLNTAWRCQILSWAYARPFLFDPRQPHVTFLHSWQWICPNFRAYYHHRGEDT